MRRVRFTMRRLMVAVAIVALAIGIHLALRRRAATFGARSTALRAQWISISSIRAEAGDSPARRRLLGRIAESQMKYERAARQPWLPVAPDRVGPG